MKKMSKIVVVALALALLSGTTWILADQEIATKTDQRCTACHDKPGSKLLTDMGLYYEMMGSLDGFDNLKGSFGRCTACHAKKPGSDKLTAEGKKMADLVDSMEELKKWLEENHPEAAKDSGEDE
jgi:cytochrome c553